MMNKKNKVLLSTVGLLLLSGIAATSSTFAWFTTVRSATVNYSEAEAKTSSGNLVLTYVESLNTVTPSSTNPLTGTALAITGANAITDISGDGLSFYKPVWFDQSANDQDNFVASDIIDLKVGDMDEGDADGLFVDFTINVSRDNPGGNGLKVYLGVGTEFESLVGGKDMVPALRMAVINDGTVMVRWAPIAEAGAKYLVANAGEDAYGVDDFELVAESGTPFKEGAITTASTIAAANALGTHVADLTGNVEDVDLTFRVWLEGTDAQTVNGLVGGKFKLDIDLYALEVVA